MKKIKVGLLFAAILAAISGCSGDKKIPSEPKFFKIGLVVWSDTETHGKDSIDYARIAVEASGGELCVKTGAITMEDQISDVRELLEAGCDGISLCAMSDPCVLQTSRICREYKVPFVLWDSRIQQETIQEELKTNPYYVGETYVNNERLGYQTVANLYAKGARQLVVFSYLSDNSTAAGREKGIWRACRELPGLSVVQTTRGIVTSDTVGELMNDLITVSPQIDGVIIIGGTQDYINGISEFLDKTGKTRQIKVGSIDFCENMPELMREGTLSLVSGGHSVMTFYSSLMLLNELSGTPLAEEPISIEIPFYTLNEVSEVKQYEKMMADKVWPFTKAGALHLLKSYNQELTYENFVNICTEENIYFN